MVKVSGVITKSASAWRPGRCLMMLDLNTICTGSGNAAGLEYAPNVTSHIIAQAQGSSLSRLRFCRFTDLNLISPATCASGG